MMPRSPTGLRDTLRSTHTTYGTVPQCASLKASLREQHSGRCRVSLGLSPPRSGEVDWVSMGVIYLITFISEAARGLLLSSAWPFFRSVGGSKSMLGIFVGMLSYGRMITTIPLGYLSDSGSMAHVFYATSIVQIGGHILYVLAPSVPGLIAARLVIGFGSSTLNVCQAYISRSVPSSERTVHFAYVSALQFGAFAILPAFGGMFSLVPSVNLFGIAFNAFTYPAALLVLCNILVLAAVYTVFIDPPVPAEVAARNVVDLPDTTVDVLDTKESRPSVNYLPMITCALTNIVLRGAIATLETLATPFLMEQYHMSFERTGLYMTVLGIAGLAVFAGFKPIARRVSDRFLVASGLAATCIAVIPLCVAKVARYLPAGFYAAFLGLIWSVGYPVGQTGALSLFSKTTQGLPAGGLLGLYSASGSLSRVLFAIVEGAVWGWYGRESVFASILVFATAALFLVGIVWRKLGVARAQKR